MGSELPVRITAMYDSVNAINAIHSGQFAKRTAGGGTRTHTRLPPTDFESASSTIPTHRLTFKDDSIDSFFLQEKDHGLQRI